MNAMLSTTLPLPAILNQAIAAVPGRRHRIDTHFLTAFDVERFNNLLVRLGRRQAPLNRDQVVTAARELCARSIPAVEPASIQQRMRRVETAARMVDDPGWKAVDEAIDTARLVIDYARGSDDLIPDWVPQVGRLDDAIVVDAAWPRLADEVGDYLDFCRLRDAETGSRCNPRNGFNRDDWQQARLEEAALAEHQRRVREQSYLPAPAAMFHVH